MKNKIVEISYPSHPIVHRTVVAIEIAPYHNGLDVSFFFSDRDKIPDNLRRELSICKTTQERQKIYDMLSYDHTLYQEGALFGIEYAYASYKKVYDEVEGLSVVVKGIRYGHAPTNESVAYVSALAVFRALDFYPMLPMYVKKIKDNEQIIFIFPETDEIPPIGKLTPKNIYKKYKNTEELERALAAYNKMIDNYRLDCLS